MLNRVAVRVAVDTQRALFALEEGGDFGEGAFASLFEFVLAWGEEDALLEHERHAFAGHPGMRAHFAGQTFELFLKRAPLVPLRGQQVLEFLADAFLVFVHPFPAIYVLFQLFHSVLQRSNADRLLLVEILQLVRAVTKLVQVCLPDQGAALGGSENEKGEREST